MAGSYDHATADDGQLLVNEDFPRRVENLGDAYETAGQMYGMIWWLAQQLSAATGTQASDLVEQAKKEFLPV
ncbi:hypothetical protein [Rhodococcus koreensis]|uniref:hypothetical protein n=1 Tax=Rhodococcus koreensis TaxID=99653 RepID=UPI0036705126